ncbi:P-loop containing nucleoside triphosphate hydrolase protein [Mycena epipterygia]|nr:P-loop containing nucleoside triphosphate hydrolase protein [Mycena epipterygia]
MLPAQPKIFHGRESELKHIAEILHQDSPRIAILGAGGMGKTSLAKAALHHPDIVCKYQNRFFVAADSTTNSIELAALIGLHLGLKPGKDLTKSVVYYFSNKGPSLLVLDNLETLWEPMKSRGGVEEFLSSLTDITMRGAERPAKVCWTHPFLQPLDPLSDDAACQTFIAIAEDFHDNEDITKLLSLTDNMPLAVLTRWATEKTSLLSNGYDKRSNLDISITISLSSPRLSSGSKDLLSLLSILPDGISDAELLQSKLSIKNILECRSMLLRTSLAYEDNRKRLKSLVPIREHMQQFYPASPPLIQQVEKHFHLLLDVYENHHGSQQVVSQLNQIISNRSNLHQVLLRGLQQDNPTLANTINCAISLARFSQQSGYGHHVLMNYIPAALSSIHDDRLEVLFIVEVFHSWIYQPIVTPEQLIAQAIYHFRKFNDLLLECEFFTCFQ